MINTFFENLGSKSSAFIDMNNCKLYYPSSIGCSIYYYYYYYKFYSLYYLTSALINLYSFDRTLNGYSFS